MQRQRGGVALLLAAVVAVHIAALNVLDRPCYATASAEGERVAAFLRNVEDARRRVAAGKEDAAELVLPRDHGWDIRIEVGDPSQRGP